MNQVPDDPLLTAQQSAAEAGISLAGFWRGVASGAFPAPYYPLPRVPRWRRSELKAVIDTRRMAPSEAKTMRRRQAKLMSP